MSAKSLVAAVFGNMRKHKAETKKSMTLDEALESVKGDPQLAIVKDDGTPYEYNKRDATPKDRLKQALSSVRSQFKAGSKADPKWVAVCDAISDTLGLGRGGEVTLPADIDTEAINDLL